MKKVIKIIFYLKLLSLIFTPLLSEEITANTSVIEKVKELGEFDEPEKISCWHAKFISLWM